MKLIRSHLSILVLAMGLAASSVQAAALECTGTLSDCLLHAAETAAGTVRREGEREEAWLAIASALAHLGRLDEALVYAERIADARTLADALGEVSAAAARAGDFERASRIALSIVDARFGSARVKAFEALAVEQAAAGQIDAAFETVIAIDNPFRRSEAQAAIATSVARSGNIPDAIRAASRIAMDYWFSADQSQLKIASGLVIRTGEFDQFWFFEALANIANLQARNGNVLGALQTARAIPDLAGRSRALAGIAVVQAAAGDLTGAYDTARGIEAAYGDLDALVAIADATAKAGDVDAALDLAREIVAAYGDSSALVAVALQQARRGQVEAGLATAAEIGNVENRTRALAGIAREMARGGGLETALGVVAMIPEAGDRSGVVRDIAIAFAAAGEAAQALDLVATHVERRDQDDVVVAIALAQATAGDPDGAIATALGLRDAVARAIALAGIAQRVG